MENIMSKKKMLFFHHCGAVGGAGISGLSFLNSVPKEQYDITVCSVSVPDNMVHIFEGNGYRVIPCGESPTAFTHCVGGEKAACSPRALINYVKVWRDKKKVDRIIRQERPDVVVANSMTLFWIGKIAKKYGAETICFFRETYIHGWFGLRTAIIKSQLSKYFDKIAFISNYELTRSQKIKSKKKTIYNMVPKDGYDRYSKAQARELLGLDPDTFYVLYVGGINQLKGALVLLKAFSEIKDKAVKLLFVGGTLEQMQKNAEPADIKRKLKNLFVKNYSKQCLECIEENNLHEQIVFFPSQSDISPFYCGADLLAFPMTAPHQARPLFEAGYAKIPVVVTDFENIYELVDSNSGYLFRNNDHQQLAQIILDIKKHYEATRSRVECNYVNTIARHSPEVYKQQIEELLSWS